MISVKLKLLSAQGALANIVVFVDEIRIPCTPYINQYLIHVLLMSLKKSIKATEVEYVVRVALKLCYLICIVKIYVANGALFDRGVSMSTLYISPTLLFSLI